MRPIYLLTAVGAFIVAGAADARAQNFFGNNTAFDPEISIVETGAKLDVQATVSSDRKYVTLTMQPQVATLLALREFTFQGPGGVVGMGANNGNANPARNGPTTGSRKGPLMPALAKPAAQDKPTPVLMREGMTRVDVAK